MRLSLATIVAVLTGILVSSPAASAQARLDVVHAFDHQGAIRPAAGLIQATDGNFYGTTEGPLGTVFKMTPSGTVTVLHAFIGGPTDGANPTAALVQAQDGNFYGTTSLGGASNWGTVFKITPGGTMTILYSFPGSTGFENPREPGALIQATDGNFYGTTLHGGALDRGTIFRITPDGVLTTLYEFTGEADGRFPRAALIQATDGLLYGVTSDGSSPIRGTAFRITLDGTLTVLHTFLGGTTDGADPYAALIQASDGDFYGTTVQGGTSDWGTIFKMTGDGTVTILHSFSRGTEGTRASLMHAIDGNFYGTTHEGGASEAGAVFTMTPGGTLTVLHTFTGGTTDGAAPNPLSQAADGNIYGTTNLGGTSSNGTVFSMIPGGVPTILSSFTGATGGANPQASLIQATDGDFYGTTSNGGAFNLGTIFKMTAGGIVTVLHAFTGGADGASPCCNVIQAADGNFYGTTTYGGAPGIPGTPGYGTVFKMTPSGTLSVLHIFTNSPDGAHPRAGLIQATDGNFYGTTSSSGPSGNGTLFKMTPSGTVTLLLAFGSGPGPFGTGGLSPTSALIQAANGNLYLTTRQGGLWRYGTVYEVTMPSGPIFVLHHFTGGSDGGSPSGSLIQATDGNFYGTMDGSHGYGAVFRMTPNGGVTVLHSFDGTTGGAFPQSALIQATDGTLYGTTLAGGNSDYGTVFRMTLAGTVAVVHRFALGLDGANPQASLLQAADGRFYGTTFSGGVSGTGVVFRLMILPTPPATLVSPAGTISANAPTYTWQMVPDASVYSLSVNNASGTPVVQASYDTSVCAVATCSVTPGVPLSAGTYTWFVGTRNSFGVGPTSSPLTFVTTTKRAGDFDGDGRAEVAVFRPSNGTWYIRGARVGATFGGYGDIPVARDYDGDGSADIAVFRPTTGAWYIWQSSSQTGITYTWGGGNDIPVPADYDGDGLADIAVFRPPTGVWYIWLSRTQTGVAYAWGDPGDIPVPADYDRDGKTDIAVFRPSTGAWNIWRSATQTGITYTGGGTGDIPVPADYDGDGYAQHAVFRPLTGEWFIWQPTQTVITYTFGGGGDIPVPGDYDGDGKADIAVFRPATGAWYVWYTGTENGFTTTWGGGGDIPILNRQ